jgi:exodeoxyribonuclease VII small subunit
MFYYILESRSMETLSFEEAFERLEATIAALQDGKMPLDRALQQYQDGMKLAQHCNELLQRAELTIQQLSVDDAGNLSTISLDIV